MDIGYATSEDGITWTNYDENPIFVTEDVPYAGILIMVSSVHVEDDGTWVMHFYPWERRTNWWGQHRTSDRSISNRTLNS